MAKLNPVLESTRFLVEKPEYVFIDQKKMDDTAKLYANDNFVLPEWNEPIFPEKLDRNTIDFFMIGDSINFCYNDIDSPTKDKWFSARYDGNPWSGAYGMWASLKRAHEEGYPILNAEYLADLTRYDAENIFRGQNERGDKMEIPLLDDRIQILNDVGEILLEKYDGHFYNLIIGNHRLFRDDGTGIVQQLVTHFPLFDDAIPHNDDLAVFDKRAQLGPGMLCGKFRNTGLFHVRDPEELTVFANYNVPNALRNIGITVYEESLAKRVDARENIDYGSREEMEIRAASIHACDELVNKINSMRSNNPVNAMHIDYKFFNEGRKFKNGYQHHLTKTTAY